MIMLIAFFGYHNIKATLRSSKCTKNVIFISKVQAAIREILLKVVKHEGKKFENFFFI